MPIFPAHTRSGGAAAYSNYNAVDFDGTNDYLTSGGALTGAAAGSQGILSFWFRLDGGNGTTLRTFMFRDTGSVTFVNVNRGSGNLWTVALSDSTGALTFNRNTGSTQYTADATWHHFITAWDTNFGAGSKLGKIIIDAVDVTNVTADASIAFNLPYNIGNDLTIGANSAASPTGLFNGCIAELYFNSTAYLDLSVAANVQKFRTTGGKPASLGANGSTPTGAQPIVYQHIGLAGAASDFGPNLGSGGGQTINGSLDVCSSAP